MTKQLPKLLIWEYYTFVSTKLVVELPEILEPLGKEGWELVTHNQVTGINGKPPQLILIFKRPRK